MDFEVRLFLSIAVSNAKIELRTSTLINCTVTATVVLRLSKLSLLMRTLLNGRQLQKNFQMDLKVGLFG